MSIKFDKLSNGLRVCTDSMTDIESVVIAIGVKTGSRNESPQNNGISHFLEHMMFKGTAKRTALQIAEEIDMVGGIMNAYTAKEKTVYYIKVIREHKELAFDILSDIICNSVFDQTELERERGVILQELAACLDSPTDVAFDLFHKTSYPDQPLGMNIVGTEENIKSFQPRHFKEYMTDHYQASNMVLGVCGNIEHDEVMQLAQKYFVATTNNKVPPAKITANYVGGEILKTKQDLAQVQFVLGFKAYSYKDSEYYTARILADILGSGMSSRLFQEIREKRGLAYSVSSYLDCYDDAGMFCVYADVSPAEEQINQMTEAVAGELKKVVQQIQNKELEKVINQVKSALMMSLEDPEGRARKLVHDFLLRERYISHQEMLQKIETIKLQDLLDIGTNILQGAKENHPTLALYGNHAIKPGLVSNFQSLLG